VTTGGKLFLIGAAVAVAGAGLLAAAGERTLGQVERNPTPAEPLGIGLLLAAIGVCLYVLQPAFDERVAQRVPAASVRTALAMLALVVIVGNLASLPLIAVFGSRALLAGGAGGQLGALGLIVGILASEVPLLGVVWLRLVRPGRFSWAQLGLREEAAWDVIPKGIGGGLGLWLLAALVSAALIRLTGTQQTQAERFAGIAHAPIGWFIAALLAGCALAPLAEELFFRGYLFGLFRERWGRAPAYIFSAGLFAVVHLNLPAMAPIFVLGLALAYIYDRTGSLGPGMIAHGVNNLISFSLLYFIGLTS
jgi:hypothetical protein